MLLFFHLQMGVGEMCGAVEHTQHLCDYMDPNSTTQITGFVNP